MGDRVGVMSAGHLEQIAAPSELYDKPKTRFVAEFVGLTNRIEGSVEAGNINLLGTSLPLLSGSATSGRATALVRPESIRLVPQAGSGARVAAISFLGSMCRVQAAMPTGEILIAQMAASDFVSLQPGTEVRVSFLDVPVFAVAD